MPTLQTKRVGRILVTDDEGVNRRLFRSVLEAEGHHVLVAEDGVEALEKALGEHPDVILLDISMPRMDGLEVCRRLRQDLRTAHIPILIITALSTKEDRLQGIEAGANDFLTKPIEIDELRLRVRNAVYQQYLYNELQARYQELKAMAELRDSLTTIIKADTDTLSSLLNREADHGAN
jgi:CheY-like chemotaxis protein